MRLLRIGPTVYRRINRAGLTRLGQTRVDGPTSSSIRPDVSHECAAHWADEESECKLSSTVSGRSPAGKLTPKRNAVRN
jgi:hypothetical protein